MRVTGIAAAALTALVAATVPAAAATITFSRDAPGWLPNGFVSRDSPLVTVSDSSGADLRLADDCGDQSFGRGLGVYWDDESRLVLRFARRFTTLSLAFGNDDPCRVGRHDRAWLVLYAGARRVGAAFDRAECSFGTSEAPRSG